MATYDAFISYSHAAGVGVAERLKEGVEKLAKPWYRTRSSRIFLDSNSLTADPKLWGSIELALADSSWLVLVTSPNAAESQWVHREIGWWLEHRSVEQIILVVAAGEIVWDEAIRDFDPERSTALPPVLRSAFEEEPHWVDATHLAEGEDLTDREMEMVIADIAAPIRGIPKEQLVAAAEREHRRTMRWVRGTILGLLLLLVAAVVAGVIAFEQRSTARNEASVAVSRQLASTSEALAESNLDAAMLLSVQAFRTDDNAQTRAALFNADTSSPALVGFLQTEHPVSQVAGSRDGHHYVAGLKDGEVLSFSGIGAKPKQLFQLDHAITSLAIDANGSVVAASDSHGAELWRAGRKSEPLPIPSGLHAHLVGLSPSGRTVVYGSGASQYGGDETITVAPIDDLDEAVVHGGGNAYTAIDVPSDDRALLVASGSWEWKRFSTWTGIKSSVGFGARDLSLATSADGGSITETNGASPVPVWSTSRHYGLDPQPSGNVEAPLPTQKLLALSPDGSRMAIVSPGEIYDAAVRSTGTAGERQVEEEGISLGAGAESLTGQDAETVSFANDHQLISAQGDEVAIWDVEQVDRLEHTQILHLVPGCELCGPPRISISPDGARAAVTNGSGTDGFVENLDGARRLEEIPPVGFEDARTYGSPIWLEGGARVAFPVWAAAGNPYASLPPPDRIPTDMEFWPAGEGAEYPLLDAADGAGRDEAFLMDAEGGFYLRRADDGTLIRSSPPTYEPEEEGDGSAAIDPSGKLLAVAREGTVTVEELPSRRVVDRINVGQLATVMFAGDHLLIEKENGDIAVWDERGANHERTISGDGEASTFTAGPRGRLLARSTNEGTITLQDLDDGSRIATFGTRSDSSFFRSGLAFSPDEKTLYSIAEAPDEANQAELVERDLSDPALAAAACKAAGHSLSDAEWRRLVVGAEPPGDLRCG